MGRVVGDLSAHSRRFLLLHHCRLDGEIDGKGFRGAINVYIEAVVILKLSRQVFHYYFALVLPNSLHKIRITCRYGLSRGKGRTLQHLMCRVRGLSELEGRALLATLDATGDCTVWVRRCSFHVTHDRPTVSARSRRCTPNALIDHYKRGLVSQVWCLG